MIYLMRHGQDDENFIGGWSDKSLTEAGIQEVKKKGLWLKENLKIEKIITSDILRAKQTALIIKQYLQVPLEIDPRLREQNKGVLNGLNRREAYHLYRDYLETKDVNKQFLEGESLRDLYERIKIYLKEILKEPENTLFITHRGVINMIYYILQNRKLDMNKKQFQVEVTSIHELDKAKKLIRRIK